MIPAVYVHDTRSDPYAALIVSGRKTIETRSRDVLNHLVGSRVLIIRTTSTKPAEIVGAVTITRKTFCPASAFNAARRATLIPAGSAYDCHGAGKWFYHLTAPVQFSAPVPLRSVTVTHKTRSFALIDSNNMEVLQ